MTFGEFQRRTYYLQITGET